MNSWNTVGVALTPSLALSHTYIYVSYVVKYFFAVCDVDVVVVVFCCFNKNRKKLHQSVEIQMQISETDKMAEAASTVGWLVS